jgi:hypothetical protein
MAVRTRWLTALIVTVLFGLACSWLGDERSAIQARLEALRDAVNAPVPEGIGTVTHAAAFAGYFTEDVSVELGDGTAPISGREMLMGMAARLQSRVAEFRVDLADVNVQLSPDRQTADVNLTAEFIQRTPTSRRTRDAREFELTMRKEAGEWMIARVAAVRTLK